MPNSENSKNRFKSISFVDYKPAELRIKKEWLIIYYAKNPENNKLERQRFRVPVISDIKERLKYGKKIVAELNIKLSQGWSPFLEESGKNFKSFTTVCEEWDKHLKKKLKDDVLRPDTIRSYNSNLNILKEFIQLKNKKIVFAVQINRLFCVEYLDYIYIERGGSARTHNNHLGFLKSFCNWMLTRGILKENPVIPIQNLSVPKKTREYIPKSTREAIDSKLKTYKNAYRVLCMSTYYCIIRNTELGKLKVKDVNLSENSIFVSKDISKNRKDEYVTIPEQFKSTLANHIKDANPDFYLFSADNYYTGSVKMPVRKIQNGWDRLRRDLSLPAKYQFYSLKDSGITDLLLSGIPAITVRDQARHYDIKITELYTPRNMGCNEKIRNAGVNF